MQFRKGGNICESNSRLSRNRGPTCTSAGTAPTGLQSAGGTIEQVVFNDRGLGLDKYRVIVQEDGRSAMVIRFADLHRHSDYSLMDGMTTVPEMVKHTEYAGALTDHGNMYGSWSTTRP